MANDIGHFFAANPDREAAIAGIANHMKSFWTPRMRRKLLSEMRTGRSDEPLEDLPRAALDGLPRLAEQTFALLRRRRLDYVIVEPAAAKQRASEAVGAQLTAPRIAP